MLPSAIEMAQTHGWVKQPFNQDTGDSSFHEEAEQWLCLFISQAEGENTSPVFTRAQLLNRG